jgi:hypothetical protein
MTTFKENLSLKLPHNKIMSHIFKKKVDKMMKNRKGNLRKKNLKMMKKMTITRVIVKVTIIIVLKLHKMFKNKIMIK